MAERLNQTTIKLIPPGGNTAGGNLQGHLYQQLETILSGCDLQCPDKIEPVYHMTASQYKGKYQCGAS